MASFELEGADNLIQKLETLAGLTEQRQSVNAALNSAGEIIADQGKANAQSTLVSRSGHLLGAIKVSAIKTYGRSGNKYVTIGVHRKDIDLSKANGEYYPAFVEFGHAGPHPAGAHPYMRPAYDAKKDEAYIKIREALQQAIEKIGD